MSTVVQVRHKDKGIKTKCAKQYAQHILCVFMCVYMYVFRLNWSCMGTELEVTHKTDQRTNSDMQVCVCVCVSGRVCACEGVFRHVCAEKKVDGDTDSYNRRDREREIRDEEKREGRRNGTAKGEGKEQNEERKHRK